MLLEDQSDYASKKALNQVQNVVDGRTYLPHGLECVAMKYHFPLDSSIRREERRRVNRKLQPQFGTGWKPGGRPPNGRLLQGKKHPRSCARDLVPLVLDNQLRLERI
jgi:hypothetical protein